MQRWRGALLPSPSYPHPPEPTPWVERLQASPRAAADDSRVFQLGFTQENKEARGQPPSTVFESEKCKCKCFPLTFAENFSAEGIRLHIAPHKP